LQEVYANIDAGNISEYHGICAVRVFRQIFTLEDAIEFHAFAPLEALPCVGPMAFLSGIHYIRHYRELCRNALKVLLRLTTIRPQICFRLLIR
jgi:hypothetical protein